MLGSGRVQAPNPPGKHHVLALDTDPVTGVNVSSVSFSKTTVMFEMHISLFCNFTFLLGWIFYLSLVTTLRWSSEEVQENIMVQVKVLFCLLTNIWKRLRHHLLMWKSANNHIMWLSYLFDVPVVFWWRAAENTCFCLHKHRTNIRWCHSYKYWNTIFNSG